jgi:uncharacterized protein
MRQEWHDVLFAHWRLPPAWLRARVPPPLEVDLWDGQAYVAVTPFSVRGLRPPGLLALPGISHFSEINVRTYVVFGDVPGVYFFSLDATNLLAVVAAKILYALPYFKARIVIEQQPQGLRCQSRRVRVPQPIEFCATYAPTSDLLPWQSPRESLERFVTERYCLYAISGRRLYRTTIHHAPWPLQTATADIGSNTMTAPLGLTLPQSALLLHFSKFIDVLVWWPERVA